MLLQERYAFREAVKWALEKEKAGTPSEWRPQYLDATDKWMKQYFTKNDKSARCLRREYFAEPMSE